MRIHDFLDLVKERRSIRKFKPDPIPDEYIENIIEAGRWAMSGANAQPWEFIVVRDQETKSKITHAKLEARKEQYVIEMTRLEEFRHHQLVRPPTQLEFEDAPVLIVVIGDKRTFQATVLATHFITGEGGSGGTYLKSMGNTVTLMHLAAAALGLGSQWVSVSRIWEESLKAILDIPVVLDVHTIVAIGYPASEPSPGYRRELKEMVHFEKYDREKFRSGEKIIKYLGDLRQRTKPGYDQGTKP